MRAEVGARRAMPAHVGGVRSRDALGLPPRPYYGATMPPPVLSTTLGIFARMARAAVATPGGGR